MKCEPPNNQLYRCNINMQYKGHLSEEVNLNVNNVCLKGMSMRNTKSVVGCVIYCGHDTRIQRNFEDAKYKSSKLMTATNWRIIFIFAS